VILYLKYLSDARIINLLHAKSHGITYMQKPEKIYLHHPNHMYAIAPEQINKGTLRESFFLALVSNVHNITSPESGDFVVDDTYTFEVGGRDKKNKQIRDIANSFVVSDDIEYGVGNKIPVWLFGFLG
jgi:predicted AAA+ superfamily ATPase